MKKNSVRRNVALILGGLLVGLPACATQGRRTEIHAEREAVVTVEFIDVPNRLVTVREASGDTSTFYVADSIRTFPQAKVGDHVRIKYQESFAVQMKKPGEPTTQLQVKQETTKPQPGQATRGSTQTETTATVKIENVDPKANTVTFTGPRGRRSIHVKDPGMQDFARKLRPGDEVEVVFVEALALSLEPVTR